VRQSNAWDFFIAHAGPDLHVAEQLCGHLAPVARTFLAPRSLTLGDDWDLALQDAQRRSWITVVLVSEHTRAAAYQREEIAAGLARGREDPSSHAVVPVFLDGFPRAGGEPPYGLRVKHGLALSDTVTLELVARRLVERLRELDPPPSSESGPAPDGAALRICFCVDPALPQAWRHVPSLPYLAAARSYERIAELRVAVPGGRPVDPPPPLEWLTLPRDSGRLHAAVEAHAGAGAAHRQDAFAQRLRAGFAVPWSRSPTARQILCVLAGGELQLAERELDRMFDQWNHAVDAGPGRMTLVLVAPAAQPWNMLATHLGYAIHLSVEAGADLGEDHLRAIANFMVQDI